MLHPFIDIGDGLLLLGLPPLSPYTPNFGECGTSWVNDLLYSTKRSYSPTYNPLQSHIQYTVSYTVRSICIHIFIYTYIYICIHIVHVCNIHIYIYTQHPYTIHVYIHNIHIIFMELWRKRGVKPIVKLGKSFINIIFMLYSYIIVIYIYTYAAYI